MAFIEMDFASGGGEQYTEEYVLKDGDFLSDYTWNKLSVTVTKTSGKAKLESTVGSLAGSLSGKYYTTIDFTDVKKIKFCGLSRTVEYWIGDIMICPVGTSMSTAIASTASIAKDALFFAKTTENDIEYVCSDLTGNHIVAICPAKGGNSVPITIKDIILYK